MVLLSGHTETDQLGRGGFQELRQVEMAAPVTKASWMATDTATVGMDIAKAIRIAASGRPGPVHLSLPSDVLDASVPESSVVWPTDSDFNDPPIALHDAAASAIISHHQHRETAVAYRWSAYGQSFRSRFAGPD